LIAIQFTTAVNWIAVDFAVMGAPLFAAGSASALLARRLPRQGRIWLGLAIAAGFLYLWAELAGGVFTRRGI